MDRSSLFSFCLCSILVTCLAMFSKVIIWTANKFLVKLLWGVYKINLECNLTSDSPLLHVYTQIHNMPCVSQRVIKYVH